MAVNENLTTLKNISIDAGSLSSVKNFHPCINYDNNTNTIIICNGKVNLSQIFNTLNYSKVLEKNSDKNWVLNSNIIVQDNASLYINNTDTKWLKIDLNKGAGYFIKSFGSLLINNTKITSWDSSINKFPLLTSNFVPRGTIQINSDHTDKTIITNSNLSYLGSGLSENSSGIFLDSKNNFVIKNNTLSNNYIGIYFSNLSGDNVITNNNIHDSLQHGILVSKIRNLNIIENNIYNNNGNGIYCLNDCSNNNITNNKIYDNNLNGILLIDSDNNIIGNNILYSNNFYGFTGSKNFNNTISKNIIVNNNKGISVSSSNNNNIFKNLIEGSLTHGIELHYKSMKNIIDNNFINHSGNNGIYIRDTSIGDNLISNNKIIQNNYGVQFSRASDNNLVNNFVNHNNFDYYGKYGSTNKITDTIFNHTRAKFFDSTSRFIIINTNNQVIKNSFGIPNNIFSKNTTSILYPIHKNIVIDTDRIFIFPSRENLTYYKLGYENDVNKIKFKILFPDENIHTKFIVGKLKSNAEFMIHVNNTFFKSLISNSSGYITFELDNNKKFYNVEIELNSKPLYLVILLFIFIIITSIIILIIKRIQKRKV